MSKRVFITGSADGLGFLAAKSLIENGHRVVLHARSSKRMSELAQRIQGAEAILTGDLSDTREAKHLASLANQSGRFDAVIHNAGVYSAPAKELVAVNVLAPYILTSLMMQPERLIYLSSGMHLQGHLSPDGMINEIGRVSYSDTKLYLLMLCKAVARKWPQIYANAVDPGWVPTKMGGASATDDLQKGYETQVWLAASDDREARVSGRYFHHQKECRCNPEADDVDLQEGLLRQCQEMTGLTLV